MDKLIELLNLLNRKRFLTEKCGIHNAGINKWLHGKGTNDFAKKTALDEEDKAKIKAGLGLLEEEIKEVKKTL